MFIESDKDKRSMPEIDITQLENIGKILLKQYGDGKTPGLYKHNNPAINKVTAKALSETINIIKTIKESGMPTEAPSSEQKNLISEMSNIILHMRKITSFEDLDKARVRIKSIALLADKIDRDSAYSKAIKKIADRIDQITKISEKDKRKTADPFNTKLTPDMFRTDTILGAIGGYIASRRTGGKFNEDREAGLNIEAQLRAETVATSPKYSASTKVDEASDNIKPKASPIAQPGTKFTDESGTDYERYATGWKNKATGRIVKREDAPKVDESYKKTLSSQVTRKKDEVTKISQITVDKIIAKNIQIDKPTQDLAGLLSKEPSADKAHGAWPPIYPGERGPLPVPTKKPGIFTRAKDAVKKAPWAAIGLAAGSAVGGGFLMHMANEGGRADAERLGINPEERRDFLEKKYLDDAKVQQASGAEDIVQKKLEAGEITPKQAEKIHAANAKVFGPEVMERVKAKKSAIDTTTKNIEESTKKIDNQKSIKEERPVVINAPSQPIINQEPPIVLPIKGAVRNGESSFTRFQDRAFTK